MHITLYVNKHAPISKKKFTNSTIMKSSFVGFSVRVVFGFSVGELPFWSSKSIVLESSSSSFKDDESWSGRPVIINLLNGTSGIMISGSMFLLLASAKAPNFKVSLIEVFFSSLKIKQSLSKSQTDTRNNLTNPVYFVSINIVYYHQM